MKVLRVAKRDQKIASYRRNKSEGVVHVYDEKGLRTITAAAFAEQRDKYFKYGYKFIEAEPDESLEEVRKQFMADADKLKELTNGLINMYRTGPYVQTALNLFNHFNKYIPEPITRQEAEWLLQLHTGALMFATKYEGEAYKEDYCSMYPSIMAYSHMQFPYKAGTFDNITEFGKDWVVAIYRCVIIVTDSRLFRVNDNNYYTSTDVRQARELGFQIKLIVDDEPNILYWERNKCLTGSQIFGKYVKYVFDIKKNHKIPSAKKILNCLWGALSQSVVFDLIAEPGFELREGREVISMCPIGNTDNFLVSIIKDNKIFAHDWARIKPFILAKGRARIGKIMAPYINEVVRCHTDGIITKSKLPTVNGDDLGELRYEGYSIHAEVSDKVGVRPKGVFLDVKTADEYMTTFIRECNSIAKTL